MRKESPALNAALYVFRHEWSEESPKLAFQRDQRDAEYQPDVDDRSKETERFTLSSRVADRPDTEGC